jgi:predicted HTH transcriptional regulator
MATTIPQIDALLTVRSEDEHLEFKEAANNFHFEELVDYCVALANEGGGRMLLGITDKVHAGWWARRRSTSRSAPSQASTSGCI